MKKGTIVMTDTNDPQAAELRKWYDNPEQQRQLAQLETLLEQAQAVMMERGYEGANIGPVDVIVSSRKKRIHLRGYSHHIEWQYSCHIIELDYHFGISDRGEFVRRSRLVGVPGGNGGYINKRGRVGSTYGTWYVVKPENCNPRDYPLLIEMLENFLSD